MKNDKISIVSPVYNTPKKYIKKLIKSLYDQTYDNVDLILVDDGSQPDIIEYLKKVDKEYEKVQVIFHKKNKGGGEARKTGFRAVKDAEYVLECDSDDYLAPYAVEHLYTLAKKYGAELVVSGTQYVLGSIKMPYQPSHYLKEERVFTRDEIVNDLLISFFGYNKIPVSMGAKLYHKKFLPILCECEAVTYFAAADETVVLNVVSQAQSLAVSPKPVYYYRWGGGSSRFREEYFDDVIRFYNYRKTFIDEYLKDYSEGGKTARDYMDIELKNETHFVLNKYAYSNKPTHQELCDMAKKVLSREEVKKVFENQSLKSNNFEYDEVVLSGDYTKVAEFIENEIKNTPFSQKLKKFILKVF